MSRHAHVFDALLHPPGRVSRFSWSSLWLQVDRILEVRRQRRALLELDDRMLKDVGISRSDAWREGNRSLLDLPEPDNRPFRWR